MSLKLHKTDDRKSVVVYERYIVKIDVKKTEKKKGVKEEEEIFWERKLLNTSVWTDSWDEAKKRKHATKWTLKRFPWISYKQNKILKHRFYFKNTTYLYYYYIDARPYNKRCSSMQCGVLCGYKSRKPLHIMFPHSLAYLLARSRGYTIIYVYSKYVVVVYASGGCVRKRSPFRVHILLLLYTSPL